MGKIVSYDSYSKIEVESLDATESDLEQESVCICIWSGELGLRRTLTLEQTDQLINDLQESVNNIRLKLIIDETE